MIRNGPITINTKNKRITNGEFSFQFSKTHNFRTFELVKHLLCSDTTMTEIQMFDAMYKDDPNGGPLYGSRVIHVMVCHLQERGILDALNIDIHRAKFSGEMRFWARPKCE